MSKKLENKNKERVVIYIYYDEYEIDFACEKEKMLRKFCKDKKYDVVGVFRSPFYSDYDGLSPDIKTVMEDAKNNKFDRFICYSLEEIAEDTEIQSFIVNNIEFCGILFETIIEGKKEDDFYYIVTPVKNYNRKKELDLNNNPYKARFTSNLNDYQIEQPDNSNNDYPF